jgi:hypothetical protein
MARTKQTAIKDKSDKNTTRRSNIGLAPRVMLASQMSTEWTNNENYTRTIESSEEGTTDRIYSSVFIVSITYATIDTTHIIYL